MGTSRTRLTESATLVGIVSAGGSVAVLVFALFGGAIADRVERRRVIQMGQGVSVILALVVGMAVLFDVIAWHHLLMAGIVQGIMWSFLAPARQAFVPQLVGTQNLGNAIALTASAMSGTAAIAPSIAGVLYSRIGPEGVYFVIAGMSAVAVLLTTTIPRTPLEREGKKPPMLHDIRDGIQYILRNPFILTLLLFGLSMVMIVMPYRFLLPVYVVEVYGRGSESLGLLLSIVGVGSLAGSLVIASITRWHRGILLLGGGIAAGLALMTTSAIPIFYVAAPFMLPAGLGRFGQPLTEPDSGDGEYGCRVSGSGDEPVDDELRAHATRNPSHQHHRGAVRTTNVVHLHGRGDSHHHPSHPGDEPAFANHAIAVKTRRICYNLPTHFPN